MNYRVSFMPLHMKKMNVINCTTLKHYVVVSQMGLEWLYIFINQDEFLFQQNVLWLHCLRPCDKI